MTARAALLVFDDYIATGTSGNTYVYTPSALNDELGTYDAIGFEVVVDNVVVSTSGSLSVYLQHSADNRSFVYSGFTTDPPAQPDVQLSTLSTTSTNAAIGAYGGTRPLLAYVRFALKFGEATTAAHVKLFVTQRDLS
jgi:hypothetical protein